MQSSFDTPVLFLIFNRPALTKVVLNRLAEIKPSHLYVAADGARKHVDTDKDLCSKTRALIETINWECEVKLLYRDENLGCGLAVSSAITWFFENEEQGIILEDDCLPSLSFFSFCQKMLQHYKNDNRIWHIAGYNSQDGIKRGNGDYFFSQETSIWGWASWRRTWKHYNLKLSSLPELEKSRTKYNLKKDRLHSLTAMFDFWKVYNGKINTWDYQYAFYQLVNSGLSVVPNYNLVENIGFDSAATHTTRKSSSIAKNIAQDVDFSNIKHPTYLVADADADAYSYNKRTRVLKKIFVWGQGKLKRLFFSRLIS